jgi:hypothetical protein
MSSRYEHQFSLLAVVISWAGSLMLFGAAAYLLKLGLGWFSAFPVLLALYVNAHTRTAIKRVLVIVFGAPFVNASKHILFILLGFSSAFYLVRVARSFPSLTEIAYILWALALALNGIVRLLAQFGVIHFTDENTVG